jgi:hypothetical protein
MTDRPFAPTHPTLSQAAPQMSAKRPHTNQQSWTKIDNTEVPNLAHIVSREKNVTFILKSQPYLYQIITCFFFSVSLQLIWY